MKKAIVSLVLLLAGAARASSLAVNCSFDPPLTPAAGNHDVYCTFDVQGSSNFPYGWPGGHGTAYDSSCFYQNVQVASNGHNTTFYCAGAYCVGTGVTTDTLTLFSYDMSWDANGCEYEPSIYYTGAAD